MIQQAVYICDRCKLKTSYLPMLFDADWNGDRRLCEPCKVLFLENYRLWCNDPKPEVFKPASKSGGFFTRFFD